MQEAEKIIIAISANSPDLEGIHDIFIPEDPPYRMPIPIYRSVDRIGKPFIKMDPSRVGGHEPHIIEEAFFMHQAFLEKGDMRITAK